MNYKMKLSDLRQVDGLYYIGDIVDVDGSPWVEKNFAVQTLDLINAEMNQPVIDDWNDCDLFYDETF